MKKLNKALVALWVVLIFSAVSCGLFWGNVIWEKYLGPTWVWELPEGGYIYIENGDYMWIRYNTHSWNGTLDYQITLNYITVYK